MIDHDVVGLDVSMHDTLGMAIVQGFQELVDVVLDVVRGERRV